MSYQEPINKHQNLEELKNYQKREGDELMIRITNKDTKYTMRHGSEFKSMLEARDIVMEHYFDFFIKFGKDVL